MTVFFDFLLNRVLFGIEFVEVTTPSGRWRLDETLLFCLDNNQRIQLVVEVNSQYARVVDKHQIVIPGDYDDLLSYDLVSEEVTEVMLPARVNAVTEFQATNGKVIGCEIEVASADIALVLDPEDVELRQGGSAWEYCRQFAVPQLGSVIVTRAKGG